jgi:hypothetical protein
MHVSFKRTLPIFKIVKLIILIGLFLFILLTDIYIMIKGTTVFYHLLIKDFFILFGILFILIALYYARLFKSRLFLNLFEILQVLYYSFLYYYFIEITYIKIFISVLLVSHVILFTTRINSDD